MTEYSSPIISILRRTRELKKLYFYLLFDHLKFWNFEILTKHVSFYRTKVRIILWRSEMQITQNCLIRWFAEPSELCPVFFNDEEQQKNWFKKFETYERRNPYKNIDICVESSLIISHWNVK